MKSYVLIIDDDVVFETLDPGAMLEKIKQSATSYVLSHYDYDNAPIDEGMARNLRCLATLVEMENKGGQLCAENISSYLEELGFTLMIKYGYIG